MTLRDAARWSVFYVAISLAFAAWLFAARGAEDAALFLTGYVLEKVLSVDNLFAFTLVFSYFGIQPGHRHRVLRWGVIGAMVFRLVFVLVGSVALFLGRFAEIGFGLVVGWSAVKMLRSDGDPEEVDHDARWYVRWTRKMFPVATGSDDRFLARIGARRAATPALFCLVAIEATDLVFSFDSVPTVIAVTRKPLIIYSAMVFAILGLRSLYFVIEALKDSLKHLGKAVVVVLLFIAAKLVLRGALGWDLSPFVSLFIVSAVLALGIAFSLAGRRAGDAETN